MSLSRRRFTLMAGAAGVGLTGALDASAQDALSAIPEGPLRDQVAWFIDVLNGQPVMLTVKDVEDHFTPAFLSQVPADQVIATVEQMKLLLGTVTIDQVARDTTDVQAGVVLAGASGLRVRLTVVIEPDSGLVDGLLLEPVESQPEAGATAAATPMVSPVASPIAVSPPPSTDEILEDYQAASDALQTAGRAFTEAFIAGDDDTVTSMFSESVAGLLGGFSARESIDSLTTNIVSFAIAEVRAYFAGQYTPELISGLFHQGTPAAFQLMPDAAQTESYPTGLWVGDIMIGAMTLGIEVTFDGTAEALSATITIPDQTLRDHPLSDVTFEAERPIGELIDERSLPMGPSMGTSSYGASYAWGNATLAINSAFDAESMVIGVSPVMQPLLPEDPAAGVTVSTSFQLPFDGAWMVIWGGDTEFQNYHAPTPPQRYAHDIVIWRDGATYTGDGSRNEQYHCYGQPQYAPAAGTVVTVVDEYPDDTPGSAPTTDPTMHPAGNHIVIEVSEGEYVLMAHFRPGSIAVAQGDTVAAGDPVGETGNSGNSSEPHVHIHLQSGPDMFDPAVIGLPMEFENILVDGEAVDQAQVTQGQIIERA